MSGVCLHKYRQAHIRSPAYPSEQSDWPIPTCIMQAGDFMLPGLRSTTSFLVSRPSFRRFRPTMCLLTGRLVWLCRPCLPDKSAAWQHPSSVQYQNEGYSHLSGRYSIIVPTYRAIVVFRQRRDWWTLMQYLLNFRTFAVVQRCSPPILVHVQIPSPRYPFLCEACPPRNIPQCTSSSRRPVIQRLGGYLSLSTADHEPEGPLAIPAPSVLHSRKPAVFAE